MEYNHIGGLLHVTNSQVTSGKITSQHARHTKIVPVYNSHIHIGIETMWVKGYQNTYNIRHIYSQSRLICIKGSYFAVAAQGTLYWLQFTVLLYKSKQVGVQLLLLFRSQVQYATDKNCHKNQYDHSQLYRHTLNSTQRLIYPTALFTSRLSQEQLFTSLISFDLTFPDISVITFPVNSISCLELAS